MLLQRKSMALMLMAVVLMAGLLQGCSFKTDEKDGPGTELVLWTFNELHEKFFLQMADQWNQQHPDELINLKANTFPMTTTIASRRLRCNRGWERWISRISR